MAWAWAAAGSLLIAAGLADLFLVVVQYDSVGLLADRLYRWGWTLARRLTDPLPSNGRVLVRSLVAPAMVVATIGLWIGLQIAGYGLIYTAGMHGKAFEIGRGLHPGLGTALYFSGATITSLSFNDLSPHSMTFHALAASETLVGLGILTLSLTYLMNVYRALQDQALLASMLHHQSEEQNDARTILAPQFRGGEARALGTELRELHRGLVALSEDLGRYPILFYFESRRPYRSVPYILRMTGGVITAVRWGLPSGHPVSDDPWLPALLTGYTMMLESLRRRYLRGMVLPPAEPVSEAVFRAVASGEPVGDSVARERPVPWERDEDETRLRSFLDLMRFMDGLMGAETPIDRDAYRRYCEWLSYSTGAEATVDAIASLLGAGPRHLEHHPGRQSGNAGSSRHDDKQPSEDGKAGREPDHVVSNQAGMRLP